MKQENTERIELNLKDQKIRTLAALVSLFISLLVMIIKFYAYNKTGSQGVYSDAIESIVNIFTAAMAIFVIYYASKPVDDDHPYGHGKVEYFSAAFEGGLIAVAAFVIFYQSFIAFINGNSLGHLDLGMLYLTIAGGINLLLGWGLLRAGKLYNSTALIGNGHHILSDVWTSVAVILGLLIIEFTGILMMDIFLAVGAGLYLCYTGYRLMRSSIAGLLDEEDIDTLKSLAKVFEKSISSGIIQIHHTKSHSFRLVSSY